MTQSRYLFASLLQYFGVRRKSKRMTDAAFEMHLMQDGEEILGAYCWRNIEHIEELSMEYWNLRRLEREQLNLLAQVREAESTLADAQKQRVTQLDRSKGLGDEFLGERNSLLESIKEVNRDRDTLMAKAIQTKKKHSALKMKVKVLQQEGFDEDSEIKKARNELASLREAFSSNKKRLETLNEESTVLEKQLDQIQGKMDLEASDSKGEATEVFSQISKANRDFTKHKAGLGLLHEEQAVLFREVGRFLNVNSKRKDCREACKEHRGIQEQTRLLYQSVELNQKLVEKLGG
jgi:chromosome segregation ATPase